ncbi:unnamed protein product, partial [Durusdinium trenchii]
LGKAPVTYAGGLRDDDPLICFKHKYLETIGALPTRPRPLNAPSRKKRLVYLEIAEILLR